MTLHADTDPAAIASLILMNDDEEEEEETSLALPPEPAPAPAKKKPAAAPPKKKAAAAAPPLATSRQAVNTIRKLLPEAERIRIYRISERGTTEYINDYRADDVARSGSVEGFLKEYVVTKWGYGTFSLRMVKANGDEENYGTITIAAPRGEAAENPNSPVFLLEQMQRASEQLEIKAQERIEREAQQSNRMFDQMLRMMQALGIQKENGAKGGGGADPTMMMMLLQQMNQNKSPDATEIIRTITDTIRPALEKMQTTDSSLSLPPPPPRRRPFPEDGDDIFGPPPGSGSGKDSTTSVIREMADVFRSQERGDPMEGALKIIQTMKELNPPPAPPPAEDKLTMRDILGMLPGMLPMIRDLLVPKQDETMKLLLEQQRAENTELRRRLDDLLDKRNDMATEMEKVRSMMDFARQFGGGGSELMGILGAAVENLPHILYMVQNKGQMPPMEMTPEPPPQLEGPPKMSAPPKLPKEMLPICQELSAAVSANNTKGVIETSLKMLKILGTDPGWAPRIGLILQQCAEGDKKEVMDSFSAIFSSMTRDNMLVQDVADRVVSMFETNIGLIVAYLGGLSSKG